MSNINQIAQVMSNENDLANHIDNIYKLTEKQNEIKAFYKEQIRFLKKEYYGKKISKTELKAKIAETKKIYQEYNNKIKEMLNLNYSISIWEYNKANELKGSLDYSELKTEYCDKLANIKNKEQKKSIKKEYQTLKKHINPKYVAILAVAVIVSLLLVSLLVNYLYYFKIANGEDFSFKNSNHLTAFFFVCIGVILILSFLTFMVMNVTKRMFLDKEEDLVKTSGIGFVATFFDTIGVGSFAITVAGLNATKSVKNAKNLPGTLNMGLTIPNLLTGTLFVSAIQVDLTTLITLVVAAMIGSFFGAKIVNKVNKKFVALFVAICLAVAGILMMLTQIGVFGGTGTKGLTGWKLAVGIISFFVIGGLQSFGVGLYAPALAVVSLLGMETIVAFPIMTCASGFAMPATSWVFHRDNNYSPKVSVGLLLGGVLGTVVAFLIIFVGIQGGIGIKMDTFTYWLKWLAILVVYYAAAMLLIKYLALRKESQNDIKQVAENYYQQYQNDFLAMFNKKLADITEFKTFDQTAFQNIMSTNNINLLKWK